MAPAKLLAPPALEALRFAAQRYVNVPLGVVHRLSFGVCLGATDVVRVVNRCRGFNRSERIGSAGLNRRHVDGCTRIECIGLTGAGARCGLRSMSIYETISDTYEVNKANFDKDSAGANLTVILMLGILRAFAAHIGWPGDDWFIKPVGPTSSRSFYANRFSFAKGAKNRMTCSVSIRMRHGDVIDIDVSGSIEDAPLKLDMIFAGRLVEITNGDEGSTMAGFKSMASAIVSRLRAISAEKAAQV